MDEDQRESLCKTGPLKAYSRYWDSGNTIWRECNVVYIDDNNLLYLIWDNPKRVLYEELLEKFKNFIEVNVNKNKKLFSIEEEAFDKNTSYMLDYETYAEFASELLVENSQNVYKVKKVSRINICFDDENLENHIIRYNHAIKSKIIHDYQNVYYKKVSQIYKNNISLKNRIVQEATKITLKISKKFIKYKDDIFLEILNFHRLSTFKTDYEINESKIFNLFE